MFWFGLGVFVFLGKGLFLGVGPVGGDGGWLVFFVVFLCLGSL